ncbi:radical SAM protein [Candidatus Methanoperedens nitratireducens]|uniref:Putative Radical SAM domain protein n=1 Tax=Candidatus Methanoperedens nitratireducens TaxID=1392998 RepID=A0A284VNV7_9EURY|nr:radical SAM protein [Candidatus Methanoperedens nitroreducens]SNQ60965.1 putative Radical SAM domain protein [Candidatus Methanoperedens nitroreducens]
MQRDIINEISSTLLDPANLTSFCTSLKEEFNYTAEDSRSLIYQVTKQINAKLFPSITALELTVTEECNLECTYCFEKDMTGRKKMSLKVAQAAIDLLFDYSQEEEDLYITYFGGEPLLNFPLIKSITEYVEKKEELSRKRVEFSMTSNGVLLNESMAEYLARHKIKVLLSIDGSKLSHNLCRVDKKGRGTFERSIKGLEILKKFQPWIGVRMTVVPNNVQRLFDDVIELHNLGINQFIICHVTGIKWSKEDIESFGLQMRRIAHWYREKSSQDLRISVLDEEDDGLSFFGCRAARNSISVSVDGEISPCSKILSLNNKRLLYKLGDVEYGLINVLNRAELISCSKLRSACNALQIAESFRGGCFAANYEDNGNIFQPSIQDHIFSLQYRSIS